MTDIALLHEQIQQHFGDTVNVSLACGELTATVTPEKLHEVCLALRDEPIFAFEMLIDICGVDYLHYGLSEWETTSATERGFERGVNREAIQQARRSKARFAVVWHLLSLTHNHRLRIRVWLDEDALTVSSVLNIWPAANWFEREAFDLFGILFTGHPDLRRLLTDYGFMGHPFRKDFPLGGHVEPRYDAARQQVIYEPVQLVPRVLEPKVIRHDPYDPEVLRHGETS